MQAKFQGASRLTDDLPLVPQAVAERLWARILDIYDGSSLLAEEEVKAQLKEQLDQAVLEIESHPEDALLELFFPVNDPETALELKLLSLCGTFPYGSLRDFVQKGSFSIGEWSSGRSVISDFMRGKDTVTPEDAGKACQILVCGPYMVALPRAMTDFRNLPLARNGLYAAQALLRLTEGGQTGPGTSEAAKPYCEYFWNQYVQNMLRVDYNMSAPIYECTRPAMAAWEALRDMQLAIHKAEDDFKILPRPTQESRRASGERFVQELVRDFPLTEKGPQPKARP